MFPPKTILCATDFSASAANATDHASALAANSEAEIVIVHVLPLLEQFFFLPNMLLAAGPLLAEVSGLATAELAKERSRVGASVARTVLRHGTIHEEILAAARDAGADMIVLGTHGRTGLNHVLLGSVAERVVRHSPLPVMTVRRPD